MRKAGRDASKPPIGFERLRARQGTSPPFIHQWGRFDQIDIYDLTDELVCSITP
jgi:hypothetical protein